jgi:AraC-like DNA-binding protein
MDSRIQFIMGLIAELAAASGLSALEAGSLLGISEGHFLRLFKRETGTTFRRYRRAARIASTVKLVAENSTSVKQIAQRAGYEDLSNFHRDFKQVCGMSPRQWRLREFDRRSYPLTGQP